MALFKISKGLKANLPSAKTAGNCWYTIDDSLFYIDYEDINGEVQRKALNAKDAETLTGASLSTILNSSDIEIPTSAAVLSALAGKADKVHEHAISDITNLQNTLDGKAATSHGTHVTYSTTAPVMDGTASVGSASTVARSDHKHPTDTSRASKTEFDSHVADTTKHITSTERTNWNSAKTHADSAHAPSNAEKNQNAFSNIAVSGQTTVAADSATDTVTFVGSNVSITTDATNDKVTFSVANGTTSAKGVVQLTNSTSSTSTTTAATPSSVKSAYDLAKSTSDALKDKSDIGHSHDMDDLGIYVQNTEPTSAVAGDIWIDTANDPAFIVPNLPEVTSADNGKVLMVVNGRWQAVTLNLTADANGIVSI